MSKVQYEAFTDLFNTSNSICRQRMGAPMKSGKNLHGYPKNDELYTPTWIFETLNLQFDLDVCAPEVQLDWVPSKNHYSLKDDGLSKEWFGKVWCNPPFSGPKLWVEKFIQHGNGVLLAPIGSNGHWVTDLFNSEASCRLMQPTMKFINREGQLKPVMWRIMLWAMGDECVTALTNFGKVR